MKTPFEPPRVAVVITVMNDPVGIAQSLSSLASQSRRPDEIIVVDGGSTDETMLMLHRFRRQLSQLRIIEAPGTNIAAGRNRGVREAGCDIIATTDSGCRAAPDWLQRLMRPFEADSDTEFVAGFYRVVGRTLLEQVIGLATMRGQLEDILPDSFNPSARSMAMTKRLWERLGGWPEWLNFSEDTLFDHHVRRLEAKRVLARDAIVEWRPRSTLRSLARQFYRYGTGRGQTGIDARAYLYNIRNLVLILLSVASWPFFARGVLITVGLILYFGLWVHRERAHCVALHTHRSWAFPLYVAAINVVSVSGAGGFLVGAWRRWRTTRRSGLSAPPSGDLTLHREQLVGTMR